MELDRLGEEMKETGTQVVLSVDPDSGDFIAELRRGNDTVIEVYKAEKVRWAA